MSPLLITISAKTSNKRKREAVEETPTKKQKTEEGSRPAGTVDLRKLYVTNLPYKLEGDILEELLRPFGINLESGLTHRCHCLYQVHQQYKRQILRACHRYL